MNGIPLGTYDKHSIMNFGHKSDGFYPESPDVQLRANSGDLFSMNDLAAIKKLYTCPM